MKELSEIEQRKFWPMYWAINKTHLKKEKVFHDKKSGKDFEFRYRFMEEIRANKFLALFNSFLWMFPPLVAVVHAVHMGMYCWGAYICAAIFVILYHFAGMYYIIKGPMLEITEVKKKGIFSRK